MRGDFVAFLSFVHFDDLLRIDGQHFVRVDHHAEEAGVGLQESARDMQDGWLRFGRDVLAEGVGEVGSAETYVN